MTAGIENSACARERKGLKSDLLQLPRGGEQSLILESPVKPHGATSPEFRYDAFISYSRRDIEFARRLEQALRGYRPPKDLAVPQHNLRVFRDEADFTGTEYHESLARNLRDAAKLVVICSPHSASSEYVADEIRRFVALRGKEHIVSILLHGIPNNEARDGDVDRRAFPDELVRLLPTPLAADYRGFNPKRDKIRKGAFAPAWFKTLADLYADHGVDRAMVEQRERRREAQRRRRIAAISSSVTIALTALTIWALVLRTEARRQRENAEARRNEAEVRLAFDHSGDGLVKATLLSIASVRFARTVDGQVSLTRFFKLLPRPPGWRQSLMRGREGGAGARRKTLAFSPDGARIASAGGSGPVQLLDARTGNPISSVNVDRQPTDRTVLAFSPDGAFLVIGCAYQACVVDSASGRLRARLPDDRNHHGTMVWSASFSPDGKQLAMSSYGSNEALVYDIPSWRTAARIEHASSAVFSLVFSREGGWLATAGSSSLRLWRAGRYQTPAAEIATSDLVWSIAFEPDGGGLVTAGRELQAWRIVSGENGAVRLETAVSRPIEAHTVLPVSWRDQACFVAAAPDAVHLLCGSSLDEVLRVPVSSAAVLVSPDADWLVNEQSDGTLAAWPLQNGLEAVRMSIGSPIQSITIAERPGWLAAGTDSGEVVVVGLDTWDERTRLSVETPVARVNVSPAGRWLVVAAGSLVHVFDSGNWRETTSAIYGSDVSWAGFDTGGRYLIIVTGTSLVVSQPGEWREQLRVEHDGTIEAVRISSDGTKLATVTRWTAGHDSGVHLTRIFDLASGSETGWEYESGGGSISNEFMNNEAARKKRELAGGDTASVLESATSWHALELNEPSERASADSAWSVRFSGSAMQLQDAATSRAMGEFDHLGQITAVRFVPASAPRWVVSAGEDGMLAVWPTRTEDLADEACSRLQAIVGRPALEKLITDMQLERSCEPR